MDIGLPRNLSIESVKFVMSHLCIFIYIFKCSV